MGSTIWIFVGIAVLQAIVGGMAKAAEKRKKAEAARRMLENGQADGTIQPEVRASTRDKVNRKAQKRLDGLRKKRLEMLRRREDAGRKTAEAPPTTPRGAEPPPVVAAVTRANRGPGPRLVDAIAAASANLAKGRETQKAERAPKRAARTSMAASEPRAAKAPSSPKPPSGSRTSSSSRRSSSPKSPKGTRAPKPRRNQPAGAGQFRSTSGSGVSTAGRLRSRLRTSGGFREALLLGELLKPPVGLRPPGQDVG